jgi:hypothetical protein
MNGAFSHFCVKVEHRSRDAGQENTNLGRTFRRVLFSRPEARDLRKETTEAKHRVSSVDGASGLSPVS